jgi:hypothetical protein
MASSRSFTRSLSIVAVAVVAFAASAPVQQFSGDDRNHSLSSTKTRAHNVGINGRVKK